MPTAADIAWFKQQFAPSIAVAVAGTPFDADMVVAIACQETGPIWSLLRRKGLPAARVLELCVGDTIDARSVFPRSRAELEAAPRGKAMFAVARAALEDMAAQVSGYAGALGRPDKFCHGFGLFQRDIQSFATGEADWFLERRWHDFDQCLAGCLAALAKAQARTALKGRAALADADKAAVAIAYNRGSYDPARGLRQGFRDAGGRYYGENFAAWLQRARAIPADAGVRLA